MKKGNYLLRIIVAMFLLGATSCTYYTNPGPEDPIIPIPDQAYIGSERCEACHQGIYETFINSGHPYKLQKVENGVAPTYPFTTLDYLPPYFTNDWEDASYVIGGFAWKYRFVDKDGYIYTGDDAQFNFQDESIVP